MGRVDRTELKVQSPELVALAATIADLDLSVDSVVLAEVLALGDVLAAKTSTLVGEFDDAKLWDDDGASSMKAWLRHHGGMTNRDGARVSKTAKRLRTCDHVRSCVGIG